MIVDMLRMENGSDLLFPYSYLEWEDQEFFEVNSG